MSAKKLLQAEVLSVSLDKFIAGFLIASCNPTISKVCLIAVWNAVNIRKICKFSTHENLSYTPNSSIIMPIFFLSSPVNLSTFFTQSYDRLSSNESCPVNILMRVVFPAPDGPSNPNISPAGISKFTLTKQFYRQNFIYTLTLNHSCLLFSCLIFLC